MEPDRARHLQRLVHLAELVDDVDVSEEDLRVNAIRGALTLGDVDTALRLAQNGLRRRPGDVALVGHLAIALEAAGHHGEAAAAVGGRQWSHDPGAVGRWVANRFLTSGEISAVPDDVEDPENELLANHVWVAALSGDGPAAAAGVERVLASHASSPQAVVWACVAGAVPAVFEGRDRRARQLVGIARAVEVVRAEQLTPFADLQIILVDALVGVHTGDLAHTAARCSALVEQAPSDWLRGVWYGCLGGVCRESGGFVDGVQMFDRCLEQFPGDPFGMAYWARSDRAVCAAMAGHTDVPSEAVVVDEAAAPLPRFCRPLLLRNEAWYRMAVGDAPGAIRALRRALVDAMGLGQPAVSTSLLTDIARFGHAGEAAEALAGLPDLASPLAGCRAAAVSAFAADDVQMLVTASTEAARFGIQPVGWELAAAALDRAARQRDSQRRARIELLTSIEHAPTPRLRRRREPILTSRERVIAGLAAAGAPSRGIADHLGVSVRTVDNLLGRVYRKTGLSGRADLTALLTGGRVDP